MNDHTTHDSTVKLCECGCGQPAPISQYHAPRRGYFKGQPVRFIPGHHVRLREYAPPEDRFWAKVIKRGPDECWGWNGSTDGHGYGQLRIDGRAFKAHRFSYELHNGPIPDGLDCLHKCDNPPCANPRHLFLGTHRDNMNDMTAKGRRSNPPKQDFKGDKSPRSAFTNEQVRAMREQFATLDMSMNEFARLHGTTNETMRRIIKRITYQEV